MCGIVGVISGTVLNRAETKIFNQMLMTDSLRGHHATGVMSLTRSGTVDVFKRACNSQEYAMYKRSDSVLTGACIAVGHNRWATTGDSSDHDGAHPFKHGHITGVHNGTLDNQYDLTGYAQFDVDSDNLYYSMEVDGEIETIEKVEGAFTLIWHNSKDKTINLVRNTERPLAYTVIGGTLYFASEAKMLDWILHRNNVTGYTIKQLPVGEIFSLKVGEYVNESTVGKTKVTLKAPAFGGNLLGKLDGVDKKGGYGTTNANFLARGVDVLFNVESISYIAGVPMAYGKATNFGGKIIRGRAAVAPTTAIGEEFLAKVDYMAGVTAVLSDLAIVEMEDAPEVFDVCGFCDQSITHGEPVYIPSAPKTPLHCECAAICGEFVEEDDDVKATTVQ